MHSSRCRKAAGFLKLTKTGPIQLSVALATKHGRSKAAKKTVPQRGFLAGEYVGASGEVTAAAGLGANVLVGGSNRTVALQPISLGGQTGLNVAIGVAALHLGLPRRGNIPTFSTSAIELRSRRDVDLRDHRSDKTTTTRLGPVSC